MDKRLQVNMVKCFRFFVQNSRWIVIILRIATLRVKHEIEDSRIEFTDFINTEIAVCLFYPEYRVHFISQHFYGYHVISQKILTAHICFEIG